MNLRGRLIAAFAVLALMASACGLVGLIFVNRIGTSVAALSDRTLPLLDESTALVESGRDMRSIAMESAQPGADLEHLQRELAARFHTSEDHLAEVHRLANLAGVQIRGQEAGQRGQELVRSLNAVIAGRQAERRLSQQIDEQQATLAETQARVAGTLLGIIHAAEAEISTVEEEAKIQVQTGTATVDGLGLMLSELLTETLKLLIDASKLSRDVEAVGDLAALMLTENRETELAALEKKATQAFKTIDIVMRRLAGRLRSPDEKLTFASVERDMAAMQEQVIGPDGLLARQRDRIKAREEFTTGQITADRLDHDYVAVLDDVRQAVAGVNRAARDSAARGITTARIVVALFLLLTFLAALGAGLVLAGRLAAPLSRLATHLTGIQQSGEMRTLDDPQVTGRSDEIGKLSRSFNDMITELAEARRRLIDESEIEIRTQYERLNAAIGNMPQGLSMFDSENRLIICNRQYAEIYGLKPEHMVAGTPLSTILEYRATGIVAADYADNYVADILAAIAERKPRYFVHELRNGRVIAISYIPLPNGGLIATHEDITERRRAEARIAHMATHDSLTELPNRTKFREELMLGLERVSRGGSLAVLCLDLDHFKMVNDTLGHPAGDALLKTVAHRLRDCMRPSDLVARLGGDEFAILQPSTEQPVSATKLATRVIEQLTAPYNIEGQQVVIGASVGVALAPNDSTDPDILTRNADMALYRAKEDGRGTYRFFEPEMDASMQARRSLEIGLRAALALSEFELFYQPLITFDTEEVGCFEALLRWRNAERGFVSPAEFIPLAEEIGLIGTIGAWVLKEACKEAMRWPESIKIAVNLSPAQFKSGRLVLDVVSALGESKLAPDRLELEITESILLEDTDATVSTLNQLRELGVRIAMDDFGTGYSSLGYLRKFPFDKIKIDRSFVQDMADSSESTAIVRAVAGLAKTLGIATTAEGVETEEQMRQLVLEGCAEGQGYLFSKPVSADEVGGLLRRLEPKSRAVA